MPLTELHHGKLLAVEGHGPKVFFEHYLQQLGVTGVQVEDFGGNRMFRGFIKAAVLLPSFRERVMSFAVIRDAETNAQSAFQSVCDSLQAAGLPVPSAPVISVGQQPKVQTYILPGDNRTGMIETLCLESVEADPAMACVGIFFQCLKERNFPLPTNLAKAHTHAFLATRPKPDLPMWTAARNDYWNWNHRVFAPLEAFLRGL